ncbi:MAG: hypothetical protein ABI629_17120 [bacterium]
MWGKILRGALAVGLLVAALTTPRRAAATDNLEYIIPAAVAGVVAVIVIVAIVMADRTDPDMELTGMPKGPPHEGLKLAPACPVTANGRPLLCW